MLYIKAYRWFCHITTKINISLTFATNLAPKMHTKSIKNWPRARKWTTKAREWTPETGKLILEAGKWTLEAGKWRPKPPNCTTRTRTRTPGTRSLESTSPKSFFKGFTFYGLSIFGRGPTLRFNSGYRPATLYVNWRQYLLCSLEKWTQFT